MNYSKKILLPASALAFVLIFGDPESATGQPGKGKAGGSPAMRTDREVFHFLLSNRKDIRRTVKILKNGVETVTESDRGEVAKKIQEHVEAMHKRVKEGKGIHLRDPLFAEIFRHHDKVFLKVEKTAKGVKVTETSTDPYVAKLIQGHAEVVSKFIEKGHEEVRRNHPVPPQEPATTGLFSY